MLLERPIFLTGFMGAGKTTIGRFLAAQFGCDFLDLDNQIETRAEMSINEIFAEYGEDYFRQLETKVLTSVPVERRAVFATGGGIVMAAENRKFMRAAGHVVYLRTSWETLRVRLAGSTERPLLNSAEGLAHVQSLLLNRIPFYEEASLIVDTDHKSVEEVVGQIQRLLQGVNE